MLIDFNPRVSGTFVNIVLNDPKVNEFVEELKTDFYTDEEIHERIKNIIIVVLRDFEVNVNKTINKAKQFAAEEART